MSVFRIHKTNNFTVMSNTHLRDNRLSLDARGLLSVILSMPDDWEFSINELCQMCADKDSTIRSILQELKDFGYLPENFKGDISE